MEKYQLEDRIGEGSFGKVYRAKRKEDGMTVALKFVPKVGRSETEIKSLRHECEIQINLNHYNIIHMLDSFETDKSVVVVTEYASRGELSSLLMRERRLSVQQVQIIACDLVSALNYLHSRRILHRDMKPQNILIGSDDRYKLCDFGFARTMGIDTYMLTSIKGTPLYMAPEIIEEKPYDHNADLWSLGCILYELLIGRPPFFTTNLFQLVKMIRHENIIFPDFMVGDCRSFLQGLLEKDSQKRLTWPELLTHPFVRDGLRIEPTMEEFSLTKALSPSQEVAKERQRQNLQRKLAGYSKLLIKTAKKLEEAQKELKKCANDGKPPTVRTPMPSPTAVQIPAKPTSAKSHRKSPHPPPLLGIVLTDPPKLSPGQLMNHQDVQDVTYLLKNLKIDHKDKVSATDDGLDNVSDNSGSSCETLTSSSECESEDESDEDGRTVIVGNSKGRRKSSGNKKDLNTQNPDILTTQADFVKKANPCGTDTLWKSGALFTLHSFGTEDKPINSEEWVYFLISTMKEVIDRPRSLCEKHFLTVVVAPLRNHLSGPEVIEKIATLLSVPFAMEKDLNSSEPGLVAAIQTIYLDSKVVPNLLYSCKLTVRRRRLERGSTELGEMAAILTAEDLEALDKCMRLVCFLVYSDEDFVVQFCDSVCVLQLFPILQLFLKLDKRKSRLASDTLAILCQVMRNIPANSSILEDLFLVEASGSIPACEELWKILLHSNLIIKSRALRVLGYLSIHSEKTRDKVIRTNCTRVWKLLREASISMDAQVREAAEFVLQNMKNLSLRNTKEGDRCSTESIRLQNNDSVQSR